jgi:hypothetical protein
VRVLFHAFQAPSNPSKISCSHQVTPTLQGYLAIVRFGYVSEAGPLNRSGSTFYS